MSTAVLEPSTTRSSSNEDLVSWVILSVALVVSLGTHAVTVHFMPDKVAEGRKNRRVEMEFFEPPKPPPKVEEPKPEPPKPPPPKAKPPPVKVAAVKPPPEQAPPPPNEPPPPEADSKPVPLVVGISMSSTTAGGSFAIGVGNTAYGKAGPPTDPSEVKAYRAPKYVPPGGADTQPEVISEVKGTYPEEAKKNEIEGTVLLKLTIDENGNVTEVKVIKGLGYGLDEASVAAIRKFKFKPATKDGENVVYSITYNYSWYLE